MASNQSNISFKELGYAAFLQWTYRISLASYQARCGKATTTKILVNTGFTLMVFPRLFALEHIFCHSISECFARYLALQLKWKSEVKMSTDIIDERSSKISQPVFIVRATQHLWKTKDCQKLERSLSWSQYDREYSGLSQAHLFSSSYSASMSRSHLSAASS